ncbi:MAG: hypothetical protein R3B47_15300 [Bacteroidia bacterium]
MAVVCTTPFSLFGRDECVAGDANFDGITKQCDIIPIGLAFGETGPARPYPGINWQASPAFAYGD